MVLYVSPFVNHKIKYSKETIWLKLENTSIRIFVVINMYIWNLIITAPFCFPGKLHCFKSSRKLIQHAVSSIPTVDWKWRAWVTCRTEQSWEYEASLYFLFYIKSKNRHFSWYRNFIFWFKEIHFLISKNRILISRNCIYFFIPRNRIDSIFHWFFSYQEIDFLYQKSKYWLNSITAPQCVVLLFIRYFIILDIKEH